MEGVGGWEGPPGSWQQPVPGNSGLNRGGKNLKNNQKEWAWAGGGFLSLLHGGPVCERHKTLSSDCPLPSKVNKKKQRRFEPLLFPLASAPAGSSASQRLPCPHLPSAIHHGNPEVILGDLLTFSSLPQGPGPPAPLPSCPFLGAWPSLASSLSCHLQPHPSLTSWSWGYPGLQGGSGSPAPWAPRCPPLLWMGSCPQLQQVPFLLAASCPLPTPCLCSFLALMLGNQPWNAPLPFRLI